MAFAEAEIREVMAQYGVGEEAQHQQQQYLLLSIRTFSIFRSKTELHVHKVFRLKWLQLSLIHI